MNCERLQAVVIGGGAVGARKALALAEAGARVKVIAPVISSELVDAQAANVTIERNEYSGTSDIEIADIVIAATDSPELNERIAADARGLHRLVNVVTDGSGGTFTTMAVHRAGPLAIGVTAGSVPSAAARIRDAIAERFGANYSHALSALAVERERSLSSDGGTRWSQLSKEIFTPDFCARVEQGEFDGVTR
ncbi:MAG: bifunctional precorrin-2 dehydrogenase/sirohydrochlorin ferrochelatase [Gemmatimonas sp.]